MTDIESEADRAMRWVDQIVGEPKTLDENKRAQEIYGAVLERCEIARDALKEETYGD